MQGIPLILTVSMDEVSQKYFDGLRAQHFPKHCNYLNAHITLFHRLPSGLKFIDDVLKNITKRKQETMQITGVKNIGNGTVFTVESQPVKKLHSELQNAFSRYLITQDRKKWWPHITIQNKVTAFKASQTTALLQESFEPFKIQATGVKSWLYRGGPWEEKDEYLFNV